MNQPSKPCEKFTYNRKMKFLLGTCKQDGAENLDQFVQKPRSLLPDCHFTAVSAEQHSDEALRDAFISGLYSNTIRQRLLEHKSLDFKIPRTSTKQSLSFLPNNQLPCATVSNDPPKSPRSQVSSHEQTTAVSMGTPC
ncbi:hypothetical protein CLF_105275, partial [Clonorchis sinensis]